MRTPIVMMMMLVSSLAACSRPAATVQADAPEQTSSAASAHVPATTAASPPAETAGTPASTTPVTPVADTPAGASAGRIARPVLSAQGYGPVRFGDKLSAVEQKLEEKSVPLGENDPACSSVRFNQVPGARFMVEKGIVTRADADAGTPNELGLAVGDTLAQAKKKYPAIEVGPHKYLPAGHYLSVRSDSPKAAIIMEEDGKHITKIRAGLEPAVSYVEVCL
ncbi:hypothetical protein HHL21_20765 [Massilia sp. RP-1-19]|uniref:Uncharacterized protein n=1 Tax=Massilia polaris TaxID=2728846 RepID=A0A848HQT9_9BURK|nr:hypothetical protein [Massilia polaris]NML63474.1 hypothetical protein [Massilia polaris]